MRFQYKTEGTCSQVICFDLDGEVVSGVEFFGGCNGNLKAIAKLIDGATVSEIEQKLGGISCGNRPTSCSDQLAKAVRAGYDYMQNNKGQE